MMVRKFYADSPREALRLVRDALGPNAMILSNRRTAAGVEIAAVSESEIASVTGGMAMHAMTAPKPERRPVGSECAGAGRAAAHAAEHA